MLPVSKKSVALTILASLLSIQLPSFALDVSPAQAAMSQEEFSKRYTDITKRILLSGVELERFSLNYRLQNCRHSTFNKMVFFGTQEAGAGCGLAFEIGGLQQFDRARHRLLRLNPHSLQHSLRTAEVGSIVAASGSAYMLGASVVKHVKDHQKGFDTRSANRFVSSKLQVIDGLLSERESLVAANSQSPAYERAVIEGRILRAMRGTFVNEYATFNADVRSASAVRDLFFLMNTAYNTLGAVGAGVGYNAVKKPKLNGPANVLFIVSGAMAMGAPLLCSAQLWTERKWLLHSERRSLHGSAADLVELAKDRTALESATGSEGSLIPSFPATDRLALYTESDQRFTKQLQNELTTMRRLDKVALQSSLAGPAIGSLLMTQGILGAKGYYDYFPLRLKKQFDLSYKGAVCGTVGTSMAVVGNVAWLLASLSYEHHLKKQKRLPEQLIQERLNHLDEVEKVVSAL